MQRTDEVEALAAGAAEVAHDQVDLAGVAAERAVQRARPDLRVGRELVRDPADVEEQRLEVRELGLRERQQARGPAHHNV